jgi:tetratricopeptide (TPR) repeat protein
MKKTVVISLAAFIAIAAGFHLGSRKSGATAPVVPESGEPREMTSAATSVAPKAPVMRTQAGAAARPVATPGTTPAAASAPVPAAPPLPSPVFDQAIESLVSSQATFGRKQEAWKQLRDSGKLDAAITELERRGAANPNSAEYPATLGQAYLHKAGSIQDVREQGILGMKADQTFEAALNLDPSNWEARFWKATAMSYWPPQMNKGKEVIENFLELVKQQETQNPQPQYAQTYVSLGEQYEKQGYPEYALQIWKRGQAIFPADAALRQKLPKQQ